MGTRRSSPSSGAVLPVRLAHPVSTVRVEAAWAPRARLSARGTHASHPLPACGLAFLFTYLTQFCLYNESIGNALRGGHVKSGRRNRVRVAGPGGWGPA